MNTIMHSLRADSTDSLKRTEVPPPVESANQRYKASLLISAQAYFDLIGVCPNKLCQINPISWGSLITLFLILLTAAPLNLIQSE